MAPTIRIDEEVYSWLQSQAKPFEDTPNTVLRRLAKLDASKPLRETTVGANDEAATEHTKTPQQAYRGPILEVLAAHGGQATRLEVLGELEKKMGRRFTGYDRETIKSGDVRWQKTAEWEVRRMRMDGLIRASDETPRGVWELTEKGEVATHKV